MKTLKTKSVIENFVLGRNASHGGYHTYNYRETQELVIHGKLAAITLPTGILVNDSIDQADIVAITSLAGQVCRLVKVTFEPALI